MYAGSGMSYCDLSLEPTQELPVTLVTLHRVCSVTLVILNESLFCHLGDHTQEFVFNSPDRSITELVIGPDLQGWLVIGSFLQCRLSVRFFRASYRYMFLGPVIGSFLQSKLSVQIYRTLDWSITLGPVIGLLL